MRLSLQGVEGADRITVVVVPRHDWDWNVVSRFYPPSWLICFTEKDDFEVAKRELWESRGETVHVLSMNRLPITTTEVRARVAGGANWREFISEHAHEYFVDIDGPRRLFGGIET